MAKVNNWFDGMLDSVKCVVDSVEGMYTGVEVSLTADGYALTVNSYDGEMSVMFPHGLSMLCNADDSTIAAMSVAFVEDLSSSAPVAGIVPPSFRDECVTKVFKSDESDKFMNQINAPMSEYFGIQMLNSDMDLLVHPNSSFASIVKEDAVRGVVESSEDLLTADADKLRASLRAGK